MSAVERFIRLVLENVPTVMFVAALLIATFLSDIPGAPERYLTWLLFLTVGIQGLWSGTTHVMFPEVGARYIGWKTSPFQTELGFADFAIGVTATVSLWMGLEFKAAIVIYISLFYLGVSWVHIREAWVSGNKEKGNFGGLLVMTIIKAFGFPTLLYLAWQT